MKFKYLTLVNRHQDQVYSLALYILRDRAEAEDISQESFVRLWQNIDGVELDSAKSWLLTVCRNLCLDKIRQRRTYVPVEEAEIDHHPGPSENLAQDQLSRWLRVAINKLKEPYKSLIVLRDIQQQSYDYIGNTLELNLNQVKSYLFRARQQLREILQEVER